MELKPCPFCGGEADIVRGSSLDNSNPWHKVYCKACQNRTWEHPRKMNAIASWNTRTGNGGETND